MPDLRHGGRILADQLAVQGCDRVFLVPGESFLAAIDGLHDLSGIDTVVCRQEGGAAMMAEAHGKLTGRPAVCMVTRGPGATNAAAGVHVAFQDSTPLVLIVGQVGREMLDREAFQEMDYRRMYGEMAKWVAQVDRTERIPEYVSRAFHTAASGRPGPVVLALPEDVLSARAEVPDARPAVPGIPKAAASDLAAFSELLAGSERPMLIVGGGGWSAAAARDLARFSTAHQVPVSASFRCQDYLDNRHRNYCGHAGIGLDSRAVARFRQCDLLIALGSRLGEITTSGYSLVDVPNPASRFVHVYPGAEELGRVYRPDLSINASSASFAAAIADLDPVGSDARRAWTGGCAADYRAGREPRPTPGRARLEHAVLRTRERLADDAIVCNGAGNYAAWVNRYFEYRSYRTQLAPTSGSMGYGVPAAIAAALAHPDRQVVCFAGDGCFLMTGQELATARQYGADLTVVVANNGMYGTIRMHQERHYPGRVHGTGLANPDFAMLARSFGGHGVRVETDDEFNAALDDALAHRGLSLIEVMTDPQALSPAATLDEVRAAGLARKSHPLSAADTDPCAVTGRTPSSRLDSAHAPGSATPSASFQSVRPATAPSRRPRDESR